MIARFKLLEILFILILAYSCKKENDNTVTDGSGNVYGNMVTIGTQIWMTENLKTTRYSNGDSIGTTTTDISNETAPKYQWAYNNDESNVAVYGRLYTWYAAADSRNICPTGWHVPTNDDWTKLTTFLGGEDSAGVKLKESGTTHWLAPNYGATNKSHFTALPGGYRYVDGLYTYLGNRGFWWCSTESSASQGYFRTMSSIFGFVNTDGTNKQYGFSVRCIKDK